MAMHAAHNPPITRRASRPGGAVRLGVLGSLSATSSPRASKVYRPTAHVEPIHASGECSLSQPRRAAHAVMAGGVRDRKPVKNPMRKASSRIMERAPREQSASGANREHEVISAGARCQSGWLEWKREIRRA